MLSYLLPVTAAVLNYSVCELLILSTGPCALDEVRFQDLMPPLKALLICATFHYLSYSLPVTVVLPDRLQ